MKRFISIAVSVAILAVLYASIDRAALVETLAKTDPLLLALSMILLVLLILVSAYRLHLLANYGGLHLTVPAAVQSTFAANALNMFMPGKLGDLLKAVMMADDKPERLPTALALGVWEKLSDLAFLFLMAALPLAFVGGAPATAAALALFGLAALVGLVVPQLVSLPLGMVRKLAPLAKSWTEVLAALRTRKVALSVLLAMTGIICLGHLVQIALMAAALGVSGPPELWATLIALLPIAIVAGLLPLTFAGVGTRDAVLVLLLAQYIGAPTAAALGVLFLLRYLVPGLLGSPLLPRFIGLIHMRAREVLR